MKMKINELNKMKVIVSEREWIKLSSELKLELIALSRMTGEDITNNLEEAEIKLYEKLMYN